MFSVQRFDASSNESGQTLKATAKPDRIALINQRKAQHQQQQQQQQSQSQDQNGEASTSKVTLHPPTATSQGIPSASVPLIHPSRLAVSHVLRQADRKTKSSLNGGVKEKTKAKQRYLKTKKERRKKRKAVEAVIGKKREKKAAQDDDQDLLPQSAPAKKQKQVVEQGGEVGQTQGIEQKQASPESSSSSSSDTSSKDEESDREVQEEQSELKNGTAEASTANLGGQVDVAALSRFPAPRRTLQASKRDLAAQGLPFGLAYPQLVKPTLTTSVKKSDQSDLEQISPAMKARLAKMGITHWFAVQTAVIPLLLSHPMSRSLYPSPPLPDFCISAPTGSGKTLSYAVPIVEVLSGRICKRLRALIILPTRDLVNQVKETMDQISRSSQLSIATITGQQNFQQEQSLLVDADSVQQTSKNLGLFEKRDSFYEDGEIRSKVDILIATPGRLTDHLDHTPGFTLQHLRFLIIDEADRLLGQSFQEWLPRILQGLDPAKDPGPTKKMHELMNGILEPIGVQLPHNKAEEKNEGEEDRDSMPAEDRAAPAWMLQKQLNLGHTAALMQSQPQGSVQKLLFSATLTRDPAKILALQLRNAAFISVEDEDEKIKEQIQQEAGGQGQCGKTGFIDRQETFALPSSLQEHMLVTKGAEKPLQLLYLLFVHEPRLRQVLCFTKSVENASRLVKLIDIFQQIRAKETLNVREYSSDLNGAQRSNILKAFKAGQIDLLVCSDVIARGIDLPDVRHVISYDVPVDMAKYVHRVGRTARANRQGDAWTLVEEQEARHFKSMIKRGGRKAKMNKVKVKMEDYDSLSEHYHEALSQSESLYSRRMD